MCKKTKQAAKQTVVKTGKTTTEQTDKNKSVLVEKPEDFVPKVSEEKLHQRGIPVKPEKLNLDQAKLGKKSWKPWEKEVSVTKVELPIVTEVHENLEDSFEEIDFEELGKTADETKEIHDGVVEVLEKVETVVKKTTELSMDDFEEINLPEDETETEIENETETKTEKKEELKIEDFEILEEFDDTPVTLEEEKKGIEEVHAEVKQVEFETHYRAEKARIEKELADARKNKNPLGTLINQLKEVNDAIARIEHKKEAQEAIATLSRNVLKDTRSTLDSEKAKLTLSDRACRVNKDRLSKLIDGLDKMGNVPGVKKTVEVLREYAKSDHYVIGHKKEAQLLTRAQKSLHNLAHDKNCQARDLQRRISDIQEAIDRLTKGGLDVSYDTLPADAVKYDYRRQQPKDKLKNASLLTKIRQSILFASGICKWEDRSKEPLFAHEPTVNDLRQGKVSNCYMVSAVTSLIQYDPNIIKNAMREESDGSVTVRLYKNGAPIYVRVDKRTPQLVTGGAILTDGPLWMNVLERAIAFIGRGKNEGYGSLWYGDGSEIVSLFTGAKASKTEKIKSSATNERSESDKQFDEDEKTKIFLEICSAKKLGRVYNCGTYNSSGTGLNDGHAYTLLDGRLINNERYVLLRNPYANMSLKYNEKGDRSKSTTYMSSAADATCGQFLMKFDEFLRDFAAINYVTINDAPGVPAAQ